MKKRVLSILLICIFVLGTLAGCGRDKGGEEISIVSGGASEYVIVHAADATETEVYAAEELQDYLANISGVTLEIVTDDTAEVEKEIIVGKTNREGRRDFDRDDLGEDGFVIKTADSKLWLVGGGDRGTIYSVYAFLEDYLGCAFYTMDVEVVPEMESITVAIEEDEQIPIFKMRGIRAVNYMGEDISVKRHLNYEAARTLSDKVGGGITLSRGTGGHTYEQFIPPTEYFAEHPEWFGMNEKGVRVANSQLCLSNPEVQEKVIEEVKKWLDEDPTVELISVSANDNPDACLCEDCKEIYMEEGGAYSGATLRLANAVAEAIEEDYPGVRVHTYAYSFTRSAPTKTKPHKNVVVNFATMGTCFQHLKEEECEATSTSGTYVKESGKSSTYMEDMEAWSKICEGDQFWLRDYSTDFGYPLTTFPDFGNLRENMQLYADYGLTGNEHECALTYGNLGEFAELRAYLLSKLLWDPYMSEEEFNGYMDGFIEAVYGEAGPYIKEYIALAEDVLKDEHSDLVVVPNERYKTPVVANHGENELPEDLTVDMVKNYKDTDWTKYWNWYNDVEENRITVEGEEIFEKALAAEGTEIQKKKTKIASYQVTYLKSFYLYDKIQNGGKIRNMITKFIEAHPNDFTEAEKSSLPVAVASCAREQVNKEYYDFNYAFCADMVKSGFTAIRHTLSGWKDFDFTSSPAAWN